MKKIRILLSSVVLILSVSAAAGARADTFVVGPNGSDDTEAVQAALDAAAAAGPGSVVQLLEGQYYIGQITAYDFQGELRGAGKDQTIVEALPNLVGGLTWFLSPPAVDNPWPFLLMFVDGDVTIADMTIQVTASPSIETWGFAFGDFDQLWGIVAFMRDMTGSTVDNVCLKGMVDDVNGGVWGYNAINGIFYLGFYPDGSGPFGAPIKGDHALTRSTIMDVTDAIPVFNAKDASFLFGGNAADGNRFLNVTSNVHSDLVNSTFELSYNEWVTREDPTTGLGGVSPTAIEIQASLLAALLGPENSSYVIAHNSFELGDAYASALRVADMGPSGGFGKTAQFEIAGNRVEADGISGAVISGFDLDGARIAHNDIRGSANAGVELSGSSIECIVRGNNLRHLDATVARVWLQAATSLCTVEGANPTDVLDEGTDNRVAGPGF